MKAIRGFSLIELLVVVTIVAIVAAVAAPVYTTYATKARVASAFKVAQMYLKDVELYYTKQGTVPGVLNNALLNWGPNGHCDTGFNGVNVACPNGAKGTGYLRDVWLGGSSATYQDVAFRLSNDEGLGAARNRIFYIRGTFTPTAQSYQWQCYYYTVPQNLAPNSCI